MNRPTIATEMPVTLNWCADVCPNAFEAGTSKLKRAIAAATAYFLVLFTLGFILGTVRVLLVAPRLEELGAKLLELPVMLSAAFVVCGWLVAHWQVSSDLATRISMASLFLVLLGFRTLLGVTLFGRIFAQQGAARITHAALPGLTAQVIAAVIPMVVGRDMHK